MKRAAAALLLLASCGEDDPCASVDGTCLAVHVEAAAFSDLDQLELDLLYGDRHDTVTTSTGGVVTLPAVTAVTLAMSAAPLRVDVVAAGKLAGVVRGTGAAATTLAPGQHGRITIELTPPAACELGRRYCGGVAVAGDPDTVYECTAGVPQARGRCPGECVAHPTLGDTCAGVGGTCQNGGFYCGGDKLDGDPSTLYTCQGGVGTNPEPCPDGCIVGAPGTDDSCREP